MNEIRPLVRTIQGHLRGVIEKSINGKKYNAFRGIPYAKPPVGELRFKDPMPAKRWSSVRDASKFGSSSAQYEPMTKTLIGGDDCLYLNVYAPSDHEEKTSLKPVMFWIHGGGFAYGSGDDMLFGPDYLVEKDVVLVTINYRLNILGFLNLGDDEVTGNQGLKDQVVALKWVQENIKNFGGDPNNVTIFGESAGGASVHYLTMSPLAEGLFHKAIIQSGVAINPWATSINTLDIAQKIARVLGREISDSKKLAQFFRETDSKKLVDADRNISNEFIGPDFHMVPSIDSKSKNPFLPVSPIIALQKGIKVPLIIGHTNGEGILWLVGISNNMKKYNEDLRNAMYPGVMTMLRERGLDISDIRKAYFGDKQLSSETIPDYVRMQSDVQIVAGVHEVASIQAANNQSPTYMYNFSYDNGKSLIKLHFGLDMPGACHADDLSFLFYQKILEMLGSSAPELGSPDRLVIERITQMWTNFAKTGNPTPAVTDTLPVKWEQLEKNSENFRCLNIDENIQMESMENVNKRWIKNSPSKL